MRSSAIPRTSTGCSAGGTPNKADTRSNPGSTRTWEEKDEEGATLRRTQGFAHLGGATLDNEENYLIKKCFTALGAVQIENQARI